MFGTRFRKTTADNEPSTTEISKRQALADLTINERRLNGNKPVYKNDERKASKIQLKEAACSSKIQMDLKTLYQKEIDLKTLCQKEIDFIIHSRPKSANLLQNGPRFEFETFRHSRRNTISEGDEKLTDANKLAEAQGVNNLDVVENLTSLPQTGSKTVGAIKKLNPENEKENMVKKKATVRCVRLSSVQSLKRNIQTVISPIRPNPFTRLNTLISGKLGNPKMQKRSTRRNALDVSSSSDDDYTEEFLPDILKLSKEKEKTVVLPNNFLVKFNLVTSWCRTSVVNWMLNMQNIFKLSHSEYYLSVNLLDQVLARITVPQNMHQLVGLTCIWISNKFIGRDIFQVAVLLKMCSYVYLRSQLIKMEKKILKLLEFSIHTVEPSMYINAYLKMLNIECSSKAYFSVYFVLDCAAHLNKFSSTPCSVVAVAAIAVALRMFHRDSLTVNYLREVLTSEELEMSKSMQGAIICQIIHLKQNPSLAFVILNKYKDYDWLTARFKTRTC